MGYAEVWLIFLPYILTLTLPLNRDRSPIGEALDHVRWIRARLEVRGKARPLLRRGVRAHVHLLQSRHASKTRGLTTNGEGDVCPIAPFLSPRRAAF